MSLTTTTLVYRYQNQGKYAVFEAFDEIHAQLASNGNFDPNFFNMFPIGVSGVRRF